MELTAIRFIDSHAHLSSASVLPDISDIVTRAKNAHVDRMINICTNPITLQEGLLLEKTFPQIKNAGATTPHDVEKEGESAFPIFAKAAKGKNLVAIGETGLDYYYKELNRDIQKQYLIKYLHLALECHLPVIFHCREAFTDLFAITDVEYQKGAPAILHCFTGSLEEAKQVIECGWYLSLSGIVTFKNSHALRAVAKYVPLNQLLIETDTPYLAPQSQRGKVNEPSYLSETAECIAKEKGISVEKVAQATFDNASTLFFH